MQDLGLSEYFHIWVNLGSFLGLGCLTPIIISIYIDDYNTKEWNEIELFLLKL